MGLFSPHKRRPNQFNYTPRYYDPEQEALDERRAERFGESKHQSEEYKPGDRIRLKREMRQQRQAEKEQGSKSARLRKIVLIIVGVLALLWVADRFASLFELFNADKQQSELAGSQEELPADEIQQIREDLEFDRNRPRVITDDEGNPLSEEEVAKMFENPFGE
ncbi:MAG: hypothetical protein J6B41_01365 [Alistipes sp.]|nr:hypothetical protein [Alistipes sp.]